MWWISVCLLCECVRPKCVCVRGEVNVPVCVSMSLCASVCMSLFSNKDKSTLIIMWKPWSTTAVMYHASQTSFSLSLPAYFSVSPSSFLSLIKTTTRTVYRCNCAHPPEHIVFYPWSIYLLLFSVFFLFSWSHSIPWILYYVYCTYRMLSCHVFFFTCA